MRFSRTLSLVVLVTAAMATPARAAANKEHLQLLAEIRMLQEQNQQMQQMLGALQDTLKAVSTKLDEQASANRKAMADQTLAVNNIGDTVRVLREKADDTSVRVASVSQEIESLRQAIVSSQAAAQTAAQPIGGEPPPAGGETPVQPTAPPTAPPLGVSPQRMYDASYDDYSTGRFDMAIQGFQGFIQAFPRMQPMVANAQYNIGMSVLQPEQLVRRARRVPESDYRLFPGAGNDRRRGFLLQAGTVLRAAQADRRRQEGLPGRRREVPRYDRRDARQSGADATQPAIAG